MTYTKDPSAILDYGVDWSDFLQEGESIALSEWFSSSDDLVLGVGSYASSKSATATKVWLSGGVAEQSYIVTNRITTDSTPPRVDERSFNLRVKER
jgi:hypothetical protein